MRCVVVVVKLSVKQVYVARRFRRDGVSWKFLQVKGAHSAAWDKGVCFMFYGNGGMTVMVYVCTVMVRWKVT